MGYFEKGHFYVKTDLVTLCDILKKCYSFYSNALLHWPATSLTWQINELFRPRNEVQIAQFAVEDGVNVAPVRLVRHVAEPINHLQLLFFFFRDLIK